MDQGHRQGNYLEATASAMFVYALAKGINRGYLPGDYLPAVEKGYAGHHSKSHQARRRKPLVAHAMLFRGRAGGCAQQRQNAGRKL